MSRSELTGAGLEQLLDALSGSGSFQLLEQVAAGTVSSRSERSAGDRGGPCLNTARARMLLTSGWLRGTERHPRLSAAATERVAAYLRILASRADWPSHAEETAILGGSPLLGCGPLQMDRPSQLVALSHPNRRRLLEILSVAPQRNARLAESLRITHTLVSFHARHLRQAGLVLRRTDGRLQADREELGHLADYLLALMIGGAPPASP